MCIRDRASAQRAKVDVRMYRVIYDAINEIEAALKGMLAPKYQEVVMGHAEVRQTYKVSAIGTIAGCYVKDGKVTRDAQDVYKRQAEGCALAAGAGQPQVGSERSSSSSFAICRELSKSNM